MARNTVLIAGLSGLVGMAAAERFAADGWDVVGVSRRSPGPIAGCQHIPVDLTDAERCEAVFGQMPGVTHLVYAALYEKPGLFEGWLDDEQIQTNGAMLRNLFEPLSRVATGLQHVSLLHGTKAYGLHHPSVDRSQVHNPLRERDPRIPHPNFYFVQEDYLLDKQRNAGWGLSVFRPTVIYGAAEGNNMNPILPIAAYAAILRERGEALHFPGHPDGWSFVREAVDASLVASALRWAATEPAAAGEALNLTNGDVFTWEWTWPAIAGELGMPAGEHRPFSFANDLPGLNAEWAAIVDKYGLEAPRDIVQFAGANSLVYTDMVLGPGRRGGEGVAAAQPVLNSTIKGRQIGFHDCMDTEDMFRGLLRDLVARRKLPPA